MKFLYSFVQTVALKSVVIRNLFVFLWHMKMWWAMPVIVLLLVFFLLILFAQSSPLGPLIYTIF